MRVVQGVASRLRPGGWFGFTVERGESYPHTLMETGRYTHHERHIREAAAAFGLEVRLLEEGFLREEASAAGNRTVHGAAQAGSVSAARMQFTS